MNIGWILLQLLLRHKDIRTELCVTASVNNVSFGHPIPQKASIVTLKANISRSFNSSMEVIIDVWTEDIIWD